jgi:hypothetical protein
MKKDYHFHTCPGGHTWQHEGKAKNCNLSNHAHCGQKRANDYSVCAKGKENTIQNRFAFAATPSGYSIAYKGGVVFKSFLTKKKEKELKRRPAQLKKDQINFAGAANQHVEILQNGGGDKKIWAKCRMIDKNNSQVQVAA